MSKTTEIKVHERGNGWPDEGDTYHDGDVIYRIDEYFGPIHLFNCCKLYRLIACTGVTSSA
jgi:hypothetical protein